MSNILAIDGGGTKTTALIADLDGKILGKGTAGPMSLAATSIKTASQNLANCINDAVGKSGVTSFAKVVIGLAGVDTEDELIKAKNIFSKALADDYSVDQFELVNDTQIALASGSVAKNAIVLISGTGSNCFGKNEKGQIAKAGGMDYLLSDQGSGFDIGQQVLKAAVKSFDGRGQSTMLEDLVCQHFAISSIEKLKDQVYHPPLNKTEIGKLATLCFTAFQIGDSQANQILTKSLDELIKMIEAVIRRLNLKNNQFDLVLVGSIATDPYFSRMIELTMNVRYPKAKLIIPEQEPVYGALKIAMRDN